MLSLVYVILPQVFVGSADQQTVVNSSFPPERALCVRIKPVTFNYHPSLRFDVIGCPGILSTDEE